jgi:hypothetical protein
MVVGFQMRRWCFATSPVSVPITDSDLRGTSVESSRRKWRVKPIALTLLIGVLAFAIGFAARGESGDSGAAMPTALARAVHHDVPITPTRLVTADPGRLRPPARSVRRRSRSATATPAVAAPLYRAPSGSSGSAPSQGNSFDSEK